MNKMQDFSGQFLYNSGNCADLTEPSHYAHSCSAYSFILGPCCSLYSNAKTGWDIRYDAHKGHNVFWDLTEKAAFPKKKMTKSLIISILSKCAKVKERSEEIGICSKNHKAEVIVSKIEILIGKAAGFHQQFVTFELRYL